MLLMVCALLSWHLLSKTNFFFHQIYEINELEEHIDRYAPRNRNRDNFEDTTQEERARIFGEMVSSINSGGSGLSDIEYRDSSGDTIDTFLTEPEVEHLVDVSDIVSSANRAGLMVSGFLLAFYGLNLIVRSRTGASFWKPAGVVSSLAGICMLALLVVAIIFIIGPRESFHILHEWFFADKGQWYFYFEDSLMTTLLPEHVFGSIAILLFLVSMGIWFVLTLLIARLLR